MVDHLGESVKRPLPQGDGTWVCAVMKLFGRRFEPNVTFPKNSYSSLSSTITGHMALPKLLGFSTNFYFSSIDLSLFISSV